DLVGRRHLALDLDLVPGAYLGEGDEEEDPGRDKRPDDFQGDDAVEERRLGARFSSEAEHAVYEQPFGEEEKERDEPEDEIEEIVGLAAEGAEIGRQPPTLEGRVDGQAGHPQEDRTEQDAPALIHELTPRSRATARPTGRARNDKPVTRRS